MCQVFEDLVERRGMEEKRAFARHLIARGKQNVEEIVEDTDLPIEVVRDLADLQSVLIMLGFRQQLSLGFLKWKTTKNSKVVKYARFFRELIYLVFACFRRLIVLY